jgi:hypothetical protein
MADELCAVVREPSHAVGSSRVHATISIGGAFLDAGTQTHHEALLGADTALYEAKVAGGDRAIQHESSPGAPRLLPPGVALVSSSPGRTSIGPARGVSGDSGSAVGAGHGVGLLGEQAVAVDDRGSEIDQLAVVHA